MKKLFFASALLVPLTAFTAQAGENCQCRANGEYYQTGAIICLGSGENRQMARCEMALNNTSWKMLGQTCPYAGLQSSASGHERIKQTPRSGSLTIVR